MKTKKKKKIHHKLTFWLGVVIVGVALGAVIQFTRAWVEPSGPAPGGNIAAPINTGWAPQTKVGDPTNHGGVTADICVDPNGDGNKKCLSSGSPSGGGGGIYEACAVGYCPDCAAGYRSIKCEGRGMWFDNTYGYFLRCATCSASVTSDCAAAGGTPIQDGSTPFCQFNGGSCPSGWRQYKSWSETAASTCNGAHVGSCNGKTSCATSAHGWANAGTESCGYKNETTGQNWNPEYHCATAMSCGETGCSGGSSWCDPGDQSKCSSFCDEMGCHTYCDPSCSLDSDNFYGCGSYSNYCSTANATCTANVTKVGCY